MTTYTVKPGDWVSKIALAVYGTYLPINGWDPVKAIAQANPQITNINVISAGQVLNIPDKPSTVATTTSTSTAQVQTTTNKAATPATKSNLNWLWYLLATLGAGGAAYALKKHKDKKKAK